MCNDSLKRRKVGGTPDGSASSGSWSWFLLALSFLNLWGPLPPPDLPDYKSLL